MKYLLCFLIVHFSPLAQTQIPESIKSQASDKIKQGLTPFIALAYYNQGESHHWVSGFSDIENKTTADINSIYEIGSITKTFTALLMAQAISENKITLNEEIEKYWPEKLLFRDKNNQSIHFKHLATHTSGLPRLPKNMNPFNPDPYANYDRTLLKQGLTPH